MQRFLEGIRMASTRIQDVLDEFSSLVRATECYIREVKKRLKRLEEAKSMYEKKT